MKTLYFDCFAGASGNMILAGLISLGVDRNSLIDQLKTLEISDFDIELSQVDRSGISSLHVNVKYQEETKHRHLSDIVKIISNSKLSATIKARAIDIFENLAIAEAKVHGIEVKKVHFHEVGAMDAIVDVVGACIAFEMLGIKKFVCSKIHVGSGFVNMAHGKFPVPPPAVAELLRDIPIYSTEIVGELITPTGAAIISTVCDEFGAIPEMSVSKTAYGAGTREYKDFPNVIRLMLGVQAKTAKDETNNPIDTDLDLIETNIDDLSPEILGFVMDRAFEIGALDCWFTAIQMKKNRPATMVSILCDQSKTEILTDLLYTETTTIGIRIQKIKRNCVSREIVKVATKFGDIDVKVASYKGKIVNLKPEFDQIRNIAVELGVSVKEIEQMVLEKVKKIIGEASKSKTV